MDTTNLRAFATKNKFCLCFGLLDFNIREFPESFYIGEGVDTEAFMKLLDKYNMTEYYSLLLAIFWSQDAFKIHCEELENFIRKKKELTEALILLLEIKEHGTQLTLQTYSDPVNISNKDIIENIIKVLIEDFMKNDFDLTALTTEETLEEIKSEKDKEWVDQWKKEQSESYSLDPMPTEKEGVAKKNQMIEDYAASHSIKREINVKYLKTLNEKLKIKKQAGAPTINLYLVFEIKHLSYLKRINRFLNQNKIEDIEEYPLNNDDCRFIHDCLKFFKIIEVKSIQTSNTTTPEKYIRVLLRQTKLKNWNSSFKMIRENINELRAFKYSLKGR